MKELDIREIADLTGVTPSALRYYEKKKLIKPVGRNGLRRQYKESVIDKLKLIALGQAAGFSLDEIATMFSPENKLALDRVQLLQRAKEIDGTIRKLQLLSRGLKHVACCTKTEHSECEEFKKIVSRGLRLVR
ncbi:helix-turn-helix domain-containing protein [Serratia quinivorans]|uniref:helix-turn-helix domain-containing protein n=1 Tax=Serratia quinivorans TaxID=137545 RepID=UPI00217B7AF3|nr:helix-turn-helix domain-containing protein [Serratia quinivorans]CAI0723211.1 Zn(II)-responsive regulator of zntA [Serratia quinivorans]CAI0749161.1 Zn(II)-responsive regulator of zntA [Serratia quinivorans]CAI1658585.1 Zn(II)-responsive regulator of zntA [Serratia quinivorans]CAI2048751.1 Zn(II)-responsive regulator of zntA [Serratia quinivorans]CAI2096381.1 Zn(II)-responsive regulator of zntA [Serratia quinivorans]